MGTRSGGTGQKEIREEYEALRAAAGKGAWEAWEELRLDAIFKKKETLRAAALKAGEEAREAWRAKVKAYQLELDTWISEKYPTPESAKLKCAEATIAMVQSFPALVRIRGHAMVGVNMRPHWWCQTKEGQIIDPTAHQWGSPPVFYEPFQGMEPHGKCLNCGELLFRSQGAQSFMCLDCSPKENT